VDTMNEAFERIYMARESPARWDSYNSLAKDTAGQYIHKYPSDQWLYFQAACVWSIKDALRKAGIGLLDETRMVADLEKTTRTPDV